jgi:glutamate racemase
VEHAVKASRTGCVAVLGTRGTIQSGVYQKHILHHIPSAKVISVACPLLVHVVEEKYTNHSISKTLVQEYVKPIKESNADTVILGCTHYPLLSHLIQSEIGHHVTLVDSGVACANTVKEQLATHGLASKKTSKGHYRYFVSDDPEKFRSIGEPFLGIPIETVELISTGF